MAGLRCPERPQGRQNPEFPLARPDLRIVKSAGKRHARSAFRVLEPLFGWIGGFAKACSDWSLDASPCGLIPNPRAGRCFCYGSVGWGSRVFPTRFSSHR